MTPEGSRPGTPILDPAELRWGRVNAVRFARDFCENGAPGEIRTPDPQIRSLVPIQLSSRRAAIASTRGRNASFWILYIGRLYGCAALAGTASSLGASRCSVVALRHRERWLSQVARTACWLSGPRLTCALPGRNAKANWDKVKLPVCSLKTAEKWAHLENLPGAAGQ